MMGSEIVKRANDKGYLMAFHFHENLALPRRTDEILNNEFSRTRNIITNLIGKT
jgi:hypothetical protein